METAKQAPGDKGDAGASIMTAQEVADYLRVHIDTVYTWNATRKLRGFYISSNRLRFYKADVESYAQNLQVEADTNASKTEE